MKHIYFFLAIIISAILISSCYFYPYNQIIREQDPYKNENRIYITFLLEAAPTKTNYGFMKPYKSVNLKFEKALDVNSDSLKYIKMYISIESPIDETFKNPIFFNINDEIFKYNYADIDNIYFTEEEKIFSNDSTKVNTIDNTTYSTSKKIRSSVNLTKQLLDKILYGSELDLRFYINESPYDISFGYDKYKKLKQFIKESANKKE